MWIMWNVIIMYLLLIPGVALYINTKHKDRYPLAIIVKAFCTAIILLTCLTGLSDVPAQYRTYAILIAMGLTLGLIADVAITIKLIVGIVFFGIGHFCYIAAIFHISTNILWGVPVFIILYTLILICYRKSRITLGKFLIPVFIYSLVITAMLSLAATMPFSVPEGGTSLCLGAALFTLSDLMFAYKKFGKYTKKLDALSLVSYFMGQSLFAVSIFLLR